MKPTVPSPVRIQCQVAQRSSRDRTVESERPPRTKDSFAPAKKMGYVTITPIAERAATTTPPPRVAGPAQHPTRAAAPAPKGIISRPRRGEKDPNHVWKPPGERFFQKLTNATPMTTIPPASNPRTRQASIIKADATTDRSGESVISHSGSTASDTVV